MVTGPGRFLLPTTAKKEPAGAEASGFAVVRSWSKAALEVIACESLRLLAAIDKLWANGLIRTAPVEPRQIR